MSAQVKRITGKITDSSGSPVSNASIMIKGTNLGTVSGIDGSYALSVSHSATALVVSAVSLILLKFRSVTTQRSMLHLLTPTEILKK